MPDENSSNAVTAAAESAGHSTLIMLLLSHLHERHLIDLPTLAASIEKAERNTVRDTPLLAGSAVITHTLAWLHANST